MGLFECKNGEHKSLRGVYFIPCLDTNLISVGQLDEDGCDIRVRDGMMRILDEQRRPLARVPRSANCLYSINLKIARSVCLKARCVVEVWR